MMALGLDFDHADELSMENNIYRPGYYNPNGDNFKVYYPGSIERDYTFPAEDEFFIKKKLVELTQNKKQAGMTRPQMIRE
jgi:hypothetical protein